MDNIFQYAFMQRAFVVAAIIAVIAPCIGVSIVLKRLSAIGDATSHSALAGIAFGLLLGINPILGAVMFSIFAVIGIEVFRKSFGKYSEIATVVVMSAGIGLTAVLSGFCTYVINGGYGFGCVKNCWRAYDFVTSCYTCCGGNDDCEKL